MKMVNDFRIWVRQLRPIVALLAVGLLLLGNALSAEAADPIEVGYRDHSYPSGVGGNSEVTAEKPENKLWWNDGAWWASMWSNEGNAYHIFKLDWATQNWNDTGTQLDPRKDTKADVLWDEAAQKLYVVSHIWSGSGGSAPAGERGELFRYSYSGGVYTLDVGFPVEVSGGTSEALVIEKDSSGMLWVTYVQDSKVWVNHSQNGDDADWVGSYVLPVGSDANVDSDDLSSVIAYDGHIGVMWSNQNGSKRMLFAVHADGTDPDIWQSVAAYTASGDDHINLKSLKSDPSGKNVFAAVKTSQSSALLILLVCGSGTCTSADDWTAHTAYTGGEGSPSRPTLLIDTSNRDLYFFARINDSIYYKRSDLDTVQFSDGLGDPFIKSNQSDPIPWINDPTTTKQTVNNTTGIVVMAGDRRTKYYFHNCIKLSGSSDVCLEANPAPSVYFSSATYDVDEAGGTAAVTVNLSEPMAGTVTVDYATQNGSAVAGSDYAGTSDTLTFLKDETTKTIYVPITNDSDQEPDEKFTLKLSGATGINLGSPDTATVTILDDDWPVVAVGFSSASFSAVEDVDAEATIAVELSAASSRTVSVNYATSGNTATAGSDYEQASGTLTFDPGQTSKSFTVIIKSDSEVEGSETIDLTLSSPSNATLVGAISPATLTIVDDDSPPDASFDAPTYEAGENAAQVSIAVKLNRSSNEQITVNYVTADGTAKAGSDYAAASGTLTFTPGQTSQSIPISLLDDNRNEPDETINLSLVSSVGAGLGVPSDATLTIIDDDRPSVNFSQSSYAVYGSAGTASIDVLLSKPSSTAVTVIYEVSEGTATAGGGTSRSLTFEPGVTRKTITIPIPSGETGVNDRIFNLRLSNPQNADLGAQATAVLTILKDAVIYLPILGG